MNVYADHSDRLTLSPHIANLNALLNICDASLGLVQIWKTEETYPSPALALLEKVEELLFSQRNTLMLLGSYYDLPA